MLPTAPATTEITWEERALAAERALAVLKRTICSLHDGSQSMLQRQLERARRNGEAMRRRQELADVRNEELRRYSVALEEEVTRRTHALQTILDNVTFGFLVVGPDARVQDGFTRSCRSLLSTDALLGQHLGEVLGLTGEARVNLELAIDQVFEDFLPEELLTAQIPHRFEMPDGRVLRADARVVRDAGGAPRGVLLTISDTTALEAAQRESDEHRLLVNLLRQRDAFALFVADVRARIEEAKQAVRFGDDVFVRRAVHTVKGNAASFELAFVASTAHEIEGRERIGSGDLAELEEALGSFLGRHRRVLCIDYHSAENPVFEVSQGELAGLEAIVGRFAPEQARAVSRWAAKVSRRPAGTVLGPVQHFVERLSRRFEKDIDFRFVGEDTLIDLKTMRGVLQNVTHMLRNAVDHGIEPPDQRGPKRPRGLLDLTIYDTPTAYGLLVEDDGRGIDVDALVRRAKACGLVSDEALAALDDAGRLRLVFLDGLSTAETPSEISGRGVGMSAVKEAVDAVGGTIALGSRVGVGTRVEIVVPKPEVDADVVAIDHGDARGCDLLDATIPEATEGLLNAYGVGLAGSSTGPSSTGNKIDEMIGLIGFTGDHLVGTLALGLDGEVAARMLGRRPVLRELEDWVAELANQLLGRCKNRLLGAGVVIKGSTPVVVSGSNLTLLLARESTRTFRLATDCGEVIVSIDRRAPPHALVPPHTPSPHEHAAEGEALLF